MAFRDVLSTGTFAVTAELGPPAGPSAEAVREKARALAGQVHAVNVTDNQAATVKVSPLAAASWVLDEGLEPILQMTTRDRNLLALQSDLLGAWALGVRTVMCLGGDPLKVGPYEGRATAVSDVDARGLASLVVQMNEGRLAAGETFEPPTGFLVIAAANPLVDSLERLEQKLESGARCFQTNIVYDLDRFEEWFAPIRAAGLPDRASILVGVTPPRSLRMLRHLHDNIPGVEVDDRTFARMGDAEGDEAKAIGIEIAVELVRGLRNVPGVAGVHLMAPGWEAEAVPRVMAAVGGLEGR